MRDMRKLILKSLDLCCELYKMYAKSRGFGVYKKRACKTRTDGYSTFKIFKCSVEDLHLQKYLHNSNKKRKPKELTRCNCEAEIQFKWIKDVDHWIVARFVAKHTHTLTIPKHNVYFRLVTDYKLLLIFCFVFCVSYS